MTIQEAIETIVLLSGSKKSAAERLNISVRQLDNWGKVTDMSTLRNRGLRLELVRVAKEMIDAQLIRRNERG